MKHCATCRCGEPTVREDGDCAGRLLSPAPEASYVACHECGLVVPWDDAEAVRRRGLHRPLGVKA